VKAQAKGKTVKRILALLLLAIIANTARAAAPDPKTLLPALAKGGYVIFVRHPQTNLDQADTNPLHLDDVKHQRQLSDVGRAQAKSIGAAFRAFGIPVEKVVSSEFQRAKETAKLLDVGPVEASADVTEGGLVVSPNENRRRAKALRGLLSAHPAPGKNLVIVSHKPNLQDAAGKDFGDTIEGEVVVFEPRGDDVFVLVARVEPETWAQWQQERAATAK
jgi:phosphohistidine phosphatase SixA